MDFVPKMCLTNQNRFDKFIHLPMEQRVRKKHSFFLPVPTVKMSLEPAAKYQILVRLEGVENAKYTFCENEWMVAYQADYPVSNQMINLGTRLGREWMNGEIPIAFKLSNMNAEEAFNSMPVETLMLYQPVIYVSEITDYGTGSEQILKHFKFVFSCLKFVAVSDFRNPAFKAIKHRFEGDRNDQQMTEQLDVSSSGEQLQPTSSSAANQTLLNGTENWIEGTRSFDFLAVEIDDEELNEWINTYQAQTQNVYHPTLKYALLEE